jgi:hypothetical protein
MSYILEALKKSDSERQQGTVPGLNAAHTSSTTSRSGRRALLPGLLLAALLLNAGLVLWWIHPWQSGKPSLAGKTAAKETEGKNTGHQPKTIADARLNAESAGKHRDGRGGPRPRDASGYPASAPSLMSTTSETTVRPNPPNGHETIETAMNVQTKTTPEVDRKAREETMRQAFDSAAASATARPAPSEILKEDRADGRRPAEAPAPSGPGIKLADKRPFQSSSGNGHALKSIETPTVPPDLERMIEAAVPGTSNSVPEEPLPTAQTSPPSSSAAERPQSASISPSTAASHSHAEKDSPGERAPDFSSLPLAIQLKIPRMSISMLIYAKNPKERMVSINGRTMHEGQEVARGLKLEHIIQNGAIFSFEGRLFRRGVF